MGIPMLKIRRSRDRLIFNMGIPILVRQHLYIETAPSYVTFVLLIYDEGTKWRRFPYHWTFAWGTQALMDSIQKGSVVWSFYVFFVVSLNKLLNSHVGHSNDAAQTCLNQVFTHKAVNITYSLDKYRVSWCPSSLCRQVISKHGIGNVYFPFRRCPVWFKSSFDIHKLFGNTQIM